MKGWGSRCRVDVVAVRPFHNTPWSDSTGPGLLTVQDAEASEDVTVIVDEDAVDERPAGWLIVTFLVEPAALLL